jgi:hypothetical protein
MHVNIAKTLLFGLAAGAAGKYFLDPAEGAKRRAMVRDKANEYFASLPSVDSLVGQFQGKPGSTTGAQTADKSMLGTLFASGAGGMLLSRLLGRRAGIIGVAPAAYALWQQVRASKANQNQNKPLEPINEPPLPSRNFE